MADKRSADQQLVSQAIRDFESQALIYASRFIPDAAVRSKYIDSAQEIARSTKALFDDGKITALQAEEIANKARGVVMEAARAKTSEMGRAAAVLLKEKNIPLAELVAKYAQDRFGRAPEALTDAERNIVALDVVAAAGRTSATVNATMRTLGRAGRVFWVLTILVAVYNVGTAKNKTVAAGREGANIGGGVLGGMAGGAAVGALVSGPFAPVGAAVGAIIGGVLGAAIADDAYVETMVPLSPTVARIVPRFTHMLWRDEEGMADALYNECGINMDQVAEVIDHMNQYFNSDADDVAYLYVEKVRKYAGIVQTALQVHPTIKKLLIDTLESGWTDADERRAIDYLKSLGG